MHSGGYFFSSAAFTTLLTNGLHDCRRDREADRCSSVQDLFAGPCSDLAREGEGRAESALGEH